MFLARDGGPLRLLVPSKIDRYTNLGRRQSSQFWEHGSEPATMAPERRFHRRGI